MFNFQFQNGKKRSGKTFSGLQKGAIRGLQIGAGFRDFKSWQEGLQIGSFRNFKSGQIDFNLGQRLQIGARGISNRGRDYKSVQNNVDYDFNFLNNTRSVFNV